MSSNNWLLDNAIKYHGKALIDKLQKYNPNILLPKCDDLNNESTTHSRDEDESNRDDNEEIRDSVLRFIAKKSKYLFCAELVTENEDNQTKYDEDLCPVLPPLETFMKVPLKYTREHFFNYLEVDDILIGQIDAISDRGLFIQLLGFDNDEKKRDIEALKIIAFCSIADVQQYIGGSKSSVNKTFEENDFVRCCVKIIDIQKQICDVSFTTNKEVKKKLGLVSPESLPAYFEAIQDYNEHSDSYSSWLRHEKRFNNSALINILKSKLNLNVSLKHSLMENLHNYKLKDEECASELRKVQTRNLALQSVSRGIELIKDNKLDDAILYLNKALVVDENNVEGLVARGALYANMGEFSKAIVDLEMALKYDPKHINAKKYLKEVFMNRAINYEKTDSYDDAIVYYNKLMALNDTDENQIKNFKTKINEINDKKKAEDLKSYYGPQLPFLSSSKSPKKNAKSRSRSASSSSSSSSSKSVQEISPVRSQEKIDKKKHSPRLYRNHSYESKSNYEKSRRSKSKSRSRSANTSMNSSRYNKRTKSRSRSKDSKRSRGRFDQTSRQRPEEIKRHANDRYKPIENTKTKNEEDEEDLEEFFNKLKQNATKTKK